MFLFVCVKCVSASVRDFINWRRSGGWSCTSSDVREKWEREGMRAVMISEETRREKLRRECASSVGRGNGDKHVKKVGLLLSPRSQWDVTETMEWELSLCMSRYTGICLRGSGINSSLSIAISFEFLYKIDDEEVRKIISIIRVRSEHVWEPKPRSKSFSNTNMPNA